MEYSRDEVTKKYENMTNNNNQYIYIILVVSRSSNCGKLKEIIIDECGF